VMGECVVYYEVTVVFYESIKRESKTRPIYMSVGVMKDKN
jgi:hypothetical protein